MWQQDRYSRGESVAGAFADVVRVMAKIRLIALANRPESSQTLQKKRAWLFLHGSK
jgi:hypothetical protein